MHIPIHLLCCDLLHLFIYENDGQFVQILFYFSIYISYYINK